MALWLDQRRGHAANDAISEFLDGGLAAKNAIDFSWEPKHEWLAVLAATANFASSDPRDKIYALVSICPPLPNFAISYEKPVPQVFREFTKAIIQHSNNLEILQRAGVNHEPTVNPHNLASWIPNFEKLNHPVLPYRNMLNTTHFSKHMSSSFKVWNASPYPHRLEPATPVSDFRFQGVQVGTIDEVVNEPVLSDLYRTPVRVIRAEGRIFVIAEDGSLDAHDHDHDDHDHHHASGHD